MIKFIPCLIMALAVGFASAERLTQRNYLRLMSPGINLGNTLEAVPTATSWGNPEPSLKLMRSIRAAGFRSIRIPAAWSQYSDSEHKIDSKWMAHVTGVVKMARKANLYVLLNVHWDGGWLQPTYERRVSTERRLRRFWTQIATNFSAFDEGLLFAGTNEVHVEGQYGPPTAENEEVQNGFNQIFIETVRATGGKNRNRFLVIQSYNTDIDAAVKSNAVMPRDTVKGRLMMEVHFYSPYNFTLNEKSKIWQWGATAKDPAATETWANESYIDSQFQKVRTTFVDNGVPVLLGEYGVGLKPNFPAMVEYQKLWEQYVTDSAMRHGMVPMYWDIGAGIGMFDRSTGSQRNPDQVSWLVKAGS
jgi:endoglucanase